MIRTQAKPKDDAYELTGEKIWITFGEHDLTQNIVHLVLARAEGSPKGIKGISLFLVPKFLPDGQRNQVFCRGLEHKMGSLASPTCVMSFEGAKGWLLGDLNRECRACLK